MDPQDSIQALASIRQARERVYDTVARDSWTYDLLYSAMIGGMIAVQAMETPLNLVFLSLGSLALSLTAARRADRTGVNAVEAGRGRARRVYWAIAVVFIVLVLAAMVLAAKGMAWGAIALGGVGFLVSLALYRLWLRVFRRETLGAA